MNKMNAIIAEKLKSLRGNLTQSQMAEKIGVALRSYQKYEAGDRFPKADVIENICSEFKVTRSFLLAENKEEEISHDSLAEAAELLGKISKLNTRNKELIVKSINQMLLAQDHVASRRKAN